MPTHGEHKTVQARILAYMPRRLVGSRLSEFPAKKPSGGGGYGSRGFASPSPLRIRPARGISRSKGTSSERSDILTSPSLFFDDLLDANVREFNPRYGEAEWALPGQFPPSPKGYGGICRNFVEYPRDRDKFFEHEEKRERDLILE